MQAGHKWLKLLFDIVGYEFDEGPLLSEGADTLVVRYPVMGRAVIVISGALITAHLANVIPTKYDILAQSFWKQRERSA